MIPNKYLFVLLLLILTSCTKEVKLQVILPEKPQQNKPINVKINNINQTDIDKISLFVDGNEVKEIPYKAQFEIVLNKDYKLGYHNLRFDFVDDGKLVNSIKKKLELFADVKPKVLSYELINVYPHDIDAFTQGLEFYKDTLYESTGLHGESSLRKTDCKTGKIYNKINLQRRYFAEGISVLNNKVYQLTWQNGVGFIYNTNLKKTGEFKYQNSKEGWGLCNDGEVLYKSDGTEKIWILDAETLQEKDFINVYTNKHKIPKINELEWVDGKIYTNVWQKNALAVIDPKSGAVEAILNLSDLHKKVTKHPKLDVLNGIAYDKKTEHLFVTGKKWDKMFEIKIVK